jgi:hypothetical protein
VPARHIIVDSPPQSLRDSLGETWLPGDEDWRREI